MLLLKWKLVKNRYSLRRSFLVYLGKLNNYQKKNVYMKENYYKSRQNVTERESKELSQKKLLSIIKVKELYRNSQKGGF